MLLRSTGHCSWPPGFETSLNCLLSHPPCTWCRKGANIFHTLGFWLSFFFFFFVIA